MYVKETYIYDSFTEHRIVSAAMIHQVSIIEKNLII